MPRTPTLDPGDRYSYTLSALVRPAPGTRMTAKVTVTGRVREGESAGKAARRIEAFAEERLRAKITELMDQDRGQTQGA